jgi:hypothetical protein
VRVALAALTQRPGVGSFFCHFPIV